MEPNGVEMIQNEMDGTQTELNETEDTKMK